MLGTAATIQPPMTATRTERHTTMWHKQLLPLFSVLLFAVSIPLCLADESQQRPKLPSPCQIAGEGRLPVQTSGYVKIGGIDQWLSIMGSSCENPVVLFVHGGPGNPLSPFASEIYRDWTSEFTLVHWDQRGAGKTFQANQVSGELTLESFEATELNLETLVKDGLEITDFLRDAFSTDSIVITGGSWGSVLATKMIASAPEKYHFYVGFSPLVNYHQNLHYSYEAVLEKAQKLEDKETLAGLQKIGSPPWKNPRHFGQLRRIIRTYEAPVVSDGPEWKRAPAYSDQASLDAYASGEEFSFLKFVGLEGEGMAQGIALDSEHTNFKVPIYLIQGREDLLTMPEISKKYFDQIEAPSKKWILVERAGHDSNDAINNAQREALRRGVAEL